jgi:hypothetical protein
MATLAWDPSTIITRPPGVILRIFPTSSAVVRKSDGTELTLKPGDCISRPNPNPTLPPDALRITGFGHGDNTPPRSIQTLRLGGGRFASPISIESGFDAVTKIDCYSATTATAAPPKPVNSNSVNLAQIMEAIKNDRLNDLVLLLRRGFNVKGSNGAAALEYARSLGSQEIVDVLLQYGAPNSGGGSMRKQSRKRSQRRRKTSRRTRRH